jgi:hypothetical protein
MIYYVLASNITKPEKRWHFLLVTVREVLSCHLEKNCWWNIRCSCRIFLSWIYLWIRKHSEWCLSTFERTISPKINIRKMYISIYWFCVKNWHKKLNVVLLLVSWWRFYFSLTYLQIHLYSRQLIVLKLT